MPPAPTAVGAGQFLAGVIALLFFKPIYENRAKPGAREFGVLIVGTFIWGVGLAGGNVTADPGLSVASYKLTLLGVGLASSGWLLTATAVVRGEAVSRRIVGTVAIWVVGFQIVLWTNPLHELVMTTAYAFEGVVFIPEYGPLFWLHTVVNYALVALGTARLALEVITSTGLRRKQMTLLILSSVPFTAGNVVTLSGVLPVPYDVSPFGYILTALLFGFVLLEGRFLDITTVARRTAMAEMDDAVVTLDNQDRVLDANQPARALFDPPDEYTGMPASEFFEQVAEPTLQAFADRVDFETEVSVSIDDRTRHFSVSVSPVGRDAASGRVFVLRDITDLKRREQELSMLQQVFSRVFRHNVRNELTVIQGNLSAVPEHTDDEVVVDRTETALRSAHRLLSHADKARKIEAVLDKQTTVTEQSLEELVSAALSACDSQGPDVTVRTDVDDVTVQVVDGFEVAIENALENAIGHNQPPLRIEVWTETGERTTTLHIDDDGAGIPRNEVTAIMDQEETALSHGSGVGLWLMRWHVDRSGGTLDISRREQGTQVRMTLQRPTPREDDCDRVGSASD